MKRILVTGGTGFIGKHVLQKLLKLKDIEIIVITRNLQKNSKIDIFRNIELVELNIEDVNRNTYQLLRKPDILIHLAWDGLPNYNEFFHMNKNLLNHIRFLENMIQSGLPNLLVTGTCFEYGLKNGLLVENFISDPRNSYSIAKDTLRKFLELMNLKYKFSFKWLRLFYMYGEGQSFNSLISQLEDSVLRGDKSFNMSGGEQIRDYLHVSEIADYIVKTSLQIKIDGIINCCSGKPISVRKFIENYISDKSYSITLNLGYYPYVDYEPFAFWGCTEKLKKVSSN
jgi:nucleoside-diphosphate-sugar epimerase